MKDINELRQFIGETMRDLKAGKLPVERAKAISQLGTVIIDSAKVEVDFIKAAGIKDVKTEFLLTNHVNGEEKKPEQKKLSNDKIK